MSSLHWYTVSLVLSQALCNALLLREIVYPSVLWSAWPVLKQLFSPRICIALSATDLVFL